ncbi:uncharacterized protein LOC135498116 [Lineus longissimus]|uniref:uncharacterized protein LOC135498116 n=1 Tax=Lineus longissimus TaxID=88925 RepID=UPI002B4C5CCE
MASLTGYDVIISFLVVFFGQFFFSLAQVPQWDNLARFKPTGSYPTAWKKGAETYYSYWAVDGDREHDDAHRRSCFVTTSSEYGYAYFWVDLGAQHDIREVIIANRKQQPAKTLNKQLGGVDLLKNFQILVTDKLTTDAKYQGQFLSAHNFSVCSVQGEQPFRASEVKQFPCEAKCRGRYLVIFKTAPKDEQFPLCEVEVYDQNSYTNVALNKPSTMYSHYKGHKTFGFDVSRKANDGQHGYLDSDGTCIHSSNAGNIQTEYWMVDLLKSQRVRRIVTVNRGDRGTGGYFRKFKYAILKDVHPWLLDMNDYFVCYHRTTYLRDAEIIEANCPYEAVGRYVMLYKYDAASNALLMCEMEVYGAPVVDENIALNKPTEMSGEIGRSVKTSGKAVDGIMARKWGAGSCIRTPGTDTTEWWAVDLLDLYKIRNVVVVNRGEEATCIQFMGTSVYIMKVKDSQLSASSELQNWKKERGRLYNNEMVYRYDAWCPKTKASTEYYQVDFINTVLLTGFTIQGGYYTFVYEVYVAYSEDGKTFKYIMDASGKNKLVMPGAPNHFFYMRTVWFPKALLAKKIRIHPVALKFVRWPCLRVDFHGCYNTENNFKNVKIKTVKSMAEYHTKSSKVQTCHDQTEPFPPGYMRPLECKDRPLGRYVIVEKTAPKQKLEMCEFEVYGDRFDGNLAYRKTTKQSSTYWKWDSKLAVDGNRASNMTRYQSCSQTLSKPQSTCTASGSNWWMVDMEESYEIGRVVVVSNAGCCGNCLQKFQILLTDTFDDKNLTSSTYKTCHFYEGKLEAAQVKTVYCNPDARGRYLVIFAPASYQLTLCEVEVFERFQFGDNLALGKPTDQSSNKDLSLGHSLLAVDGRRLTDYKLGSCTMTGGKTDDAWWHVDLQDEYRIRKLVIVNRGDALSERLRNFKVAITKIHRPFELSKVPSELCHSQSAPLAASEVKVIYCTNRPIGRHITIIKSQAVGEPLTLCEVEVYGTPKENNLAWKKPTSTSSDLAAATHQKSADGKASPYYFDGTCSTTLKNLLVQWWRVDLGKVYDVERVLITNRVDCCAHYLRSYRVKLFDVWNPFFPLHNPHRLCSDRRDIKHTGGDIIQLKCNRETRGRYLSVWKTDTLGEPLVLCEVEVYGNERMPSASTNLALGKPTQQNALVKHAVGTSAVVVDGKSDLDNPSACTKTPGIQTTEWVMVDLAKVTNVTKVDMLMGHGCCDKKQTLTAALMDTFDPEELNKISSNAYVTSSSPSPTSATTGSSMVDICGSYEGTISQGQWLTIWCTPGVMGRYLYILKNPAKKEPLNLCEVRAFSDPPPPTTSRKKRDLGGIRLPSFLANADGMADFMTIN